MDAGRWLLAVFLHPDDETFGMGGAIACISRSGRQVETDLVAGLPG